MARSALSSSTRSPSSSLLSPPPPVSMKGTPFFLKSRPAPLKHKSSFWSRPITTPKPERSPSSSLHSFSDRSSLDLSAGQSSKTSVEDELPETNKPKPLRTRNGSKLQPYEKQDVVYPVSYDPVVLHSERHNNDLCKAMTQNTLTFTNLISRPPRAILDLGCGQGWWVMDAAVCYESAYVVGFDLMDHQPSPEALATQFGLQEDQIRRIEWVHGNYVTQQLPFHDCQFDLVRMADLSLTIPCDKWEYVLSEVHRVLNPGGCLELIEDELILPRAASYDPESTPGLDKAMEFHFNNTLRAHGITTSPENSVRARKNGDRWLTSKLKATFSSHENDSFTLSLPPRPLAQVRPANSKKLGKVLGLADGDFPGFKAQTGLVMNPDILLHFNAEQTEAHATRNLQVVLGTKESMWNDYVEGLQAQGHLSMADEKALRKGFEQMIWDFECSVLPRVGLPNRSSKMMELDDVSSGSWPTASASSKQSPKVPRSTYVDPPTFDVYRFQPPTAVRRFLVHSARKACDAPATPQSS